MKHLVLCLIVFFSLTSITPVAWAGWVNGYYRRDGTYVRGHSRSNPDSNRRNNYGQASSSQRSTWSSNTILPSYQNDADSDGIWNQYDFDDNNDGLLD